MIRVCPVCGEEFETLHAFKKYCSKECAYKHKLDVDRKRREEFRAKRVPINCKICGREFMPIRKDQKYCSKKCAETAKGDYYKERRYRRSQANKSMRERCFLARRYEKLSVIICPSCTFDHCIHDH